MTRVTELTPLLKRLQLGPMAATLPERIALARRDQLDYASFLEIILSDEVNRRADRRLELRLRNAGFEETCRLEDFDWTAVHYIGPPAPGRRILPGVPEPGMSTSCWWDPPVWARPSWLRPWATPPSGAVTPCASAMPTTSSGAMTQARVDNSVDRTFRSFLSPDLLDPGRPGPPPPHRPAVGRPLRTDHRQTPGIQLRDHQQPQSSRNGSASSTTPSSETVLWTGWPMPAFRSSSRGPATVRNCRPTGSSWATGEVIDPSAET